MGFDVVGVVGVDLIMVMTMMMMVGGGRGCRWRV